MNTPLIPDFRLKTKLLLAALLTVLALPGCGSESTASKADAGSPAASPSTATAGAATQPDSLGATGPAPTDRNPCEYMARADAEAAVGQPLPKTSEHIPLGMCTYSSADYGASLTVGDWESIKAAATGGGPNHQPTAISGVGDEALYVDRPNYILYVRKANNGFMLFLSGPTTTSLPGTPLEQEKILALKILPNF